LHRPHRDRAPGPGFDGVPARRPRRGQRRLPGHAGGRGHPQRHRLMPALDKSKVDVLLERARREIDEGLLPSCQLALALDGDVVVDQCFGDANVDTRYVIFSCTKGLVAGAVWMAFADGTLAPEQKVADVIPAFG